MQKRYRILTQASDPMVSLKIPKTVFDDLNKSAEDFGRSLNTEILVRLIRTMQIERSPVQDFTSEQLLDKIFGPAPSKTKS